MKSARGAPVKRGGCPDDIGMVRVILLFKHIKIITLGLFSLNRVLQQAELMQRAHSLNRTATRQVLHVIIIGGW